MKTLKEQLKDELLNIAYGHGDEVYGLDQLVKICREWALEMVGENNSDFTDEGRGDREARKQIRDRIIMQTVDTEDDGKFDEQRDIDNQNRF